MTAPIAPAAAPAGAPPAFTPPPPPFAGASPLVAWLAGRAALDAEAEAAVRAADPEALLPATNDPERVARALLASGKAPAALRYAAGALPPREGIWWAWVAVRHALHARHQAALAPAPAEGAPPPSALPPSAAEWGALAAVERWVAQPTDEHRRAAWTAAEAADPSTPAGMLGTAVFLSTGSIAPSHSPMAVPPPPGAHVALAAGSATLAAVSTDAANLPAVAGAFLTQAAEVARQLGGWEAAATVARQHFEAQREAHGQATGAANGGGGR